MRRSGSRAGGSPARRLHRWLLTPHQLVVAGTTRLQVRPGPHGSWMVVDPDRDSPVTQFSSREQALSTATLALEAARGGRLEVADENGVREVAPEPAPRWPWWQATRTPRSGLLLGLLWLVLLVLNATSAERSAGWNVEILVTLVSGALAARFLSSSVVLLLRRRWAPERR